MRIDAHHHFWRLAEAIRFVDVHPNQIFVLDHLAKPVVKDCWTELWTVHLAPVARFQRWTNHWSYQ
jgi:predicted TIM-barrel fold metal-dependent hydrolase